MQKLLYVLSVLSDEIGSLPCDNIIRLFAQNCAVKCVTCLQHVAHHPFDGSFHTVI